MEKGSINQNRDLNSVRFQGGTFRPPQKQQIIETPAIRTSQSNIRQRPPPASYQAQQQAPPQLSTNEKKEGDEKFFARRQKLVVNEMAVDARYKNITKIKQIRTVRAPHLPQSTRPGTKHSDAERPLSQAQKFQEQGIDTSEEQGSQPIAQQRYSQKSQSIYNAQQQQGNIPILPPHFRHKFVNKGNELNVVFEKKTVSGIQQGKSYLNQQYGNVSVGMPLSSSIKQRIGPLTSQSHESTFKPGQQLPALHLRSVSQPRSVTVHPQTNQQAQVAIVQTLLKDNQFSPYKANIGKIKVAKLTAKTELDAPAQRVPFLEIRSSDTSNITFISRPIDETQLYLAESKPQQSQKVRLNLRLGAISLRFDQLEESLKRYEVQIQDAHGILMTGSARCSSRVRTANSQISKKMSLQDPGQLTFRRTHSHSETSLQTIALD